MIIKDIPPDSINDCLQMIIYDNGDFNDLRARIKYEANREVSASQIVRLFSIDLHRTYKQAFIYSAEMYYVKVTWSIY